MKRYTMKCQIALLAGALLSVASFAATDQEICQAQCEGAKIAITWRQAGVSMQTAYTDAGSYNEMTGAAIRLFLREAYNYSIVSETLGSLGANQVKVFQNRRAITC